MRAPTAEELRLRGEIGGRTVQIVEDGTVECFEYEPAPLANGCVRVRSEQTVISPGTESTFLGQAASNVYLHHSWNDELRLFQAGVPTHHYPITFGYRAAGVVVESSDPRVAPGRRVWGNWRHTEFVAMSADRVLAQTLPADVSWDDGVDIGQMAPICLNAALFGEGAQRGRPAVVFGAGPIGLLTAQAVRASGAESVYVVDRLSNRLEIAASLGFMPVNGSEVDAAAVLKAEHGSDGIPVVWECTGAHPALHDAVRVVRRLGCVVALGFYQGEGIGLRLGEEFHHNGVRIVSAQIGNPHPTTDRQGLQAMAMGQILTGRLSPASLPRFRYTVESALDAFAATARPQEVLQVSLTYDI
jgi:NADPH:quinone reductase-like Zn-dependent oxidoreductase